MQNIKERILREAKRRGRTNSGAIASLCNVSRQAAHSHLRELAKEKLLLKVGKTRGAYYIPYSKQEAKQLVKKGETYKARLLNKKLQEDSVFDKIVYTVQDIIPCSNGWLSDLERSIYEAGVGAVYTDQVPHDDATPYARYENECIRNFRGGEAVLQGLL